jgi:O-antigen/teichoic acid export membrane protein
MILNGLSPITILQGYGSIRAIAVPQLVSAMGILLGNILVARFCPTGTAYLAVQALGTALIAVMVFRSLGLTFPRAACDFRALRSTWQEAVKSGTLSVYIANISIYIYGQGDALAVSLFSPQKNMGDFMGALGLIAATNSIIGVLPSVVYARQVEWNSMADAVLFRHKQMKLLGIIGGVAVLAGIVSVFVSPVVATLVLGSKFTGSPQIFLVLLLISFLNLPYAVVASGFLALKKPRPLMLINVVIAVISIPVYAGSAYCWGPTGAVFAKLALLILMTFAALYNQLKLFAEPRTIQ